LTIAIYPGTFDPITNGHIDIATRAARLFDKIVIAIAENTGKETFFNLDERVALAKQAVAHLPNIEVTSYRGLTVDFAKKVGAEVMVRGLRMSADFEREFEMAMMNRKLNPDLELVCFMASQEYQFLSSSLLKEVASLQGDISCLVPEHVAQAIRYKALGKGWAV